MEGKLKNRHADMQTPTRTLQNRARKFAEFVREAQMFTT